MNFKYTFYFAALLLVCNGYAQNLASTTGDVNKGLQQKKLMLSQSLVKKVPFVNIGPTVMSGRVTDIDVNPKNPSEFYVAYASGGVWQTVNNGASFIPVLDNALTQNVGDIAVDWKTRTIWVGTGENNSSRSSYAGIGLLKSSDNGKTWERSGLSDSHHIGRILINPNNANELVVGVTGHLYSENKERGVFRTTDGGKTWNQSLFVDSVTGVIDLQYAPNNFNVMFASSWTKDRKAWNFNGSGNQSAVYKSTDTGITWHKVSTENSGFPTGTGVGRIGIAIYDENTIYAIHDNQFRRDVEGEHKKNRGLTKADFKTMSTSGFLELKDKKLNVFLKRNGFQEKYRAENLKQMVRSGNVKPVDIAHYLEDANAMLFDTPVIGAEIYKSTDGGTTWKKTHEDFLDGLYYSYGYYFGHIYVSPKNENNIYVYGVPILKSKNGGKTFVSISKENVHADHHALWINPKNPNHLINGNDGGVNISYDDGEHWVKKNSPAVGQFYAINVDNNTPYNVYGGLQDNGVWVGAHNAVENKAWHQSGHYPWESIMGGDGMQIEIDNRNSDIVYTGYQFGNYYRINRKTGQKKYIQPKHNLGERPYRFNWQSPIHLSKHNQDILYLGGNKLMRSLNKGDKWTAISPDLTKGGKTGNVAYGTITSVSESPFEFGLLYVGTDDGLIQCSKNGGGHWTAISNGLPQDLWVTRVIASKHKKSRVYATLNGYRWDDFKSYVYMSEDYGTHWKSIGSNIPNAAVNVIREDPVNQAVLYLGTDNGAYVSFSNGDKWEAFSNGLPAVAVHDMVIQESTNDLLIATHGRSIYKTNIKVFQREKVLGTKDVLSFFKIEDIRHSFRWGNSWSKWSDAYLPSVSVSFYASRKMNETIQIRSSQGVLLNSFPVVINKGFNYFDYDLTLSEKGRKKMLKENSSLTINKSGNDKYYLMKGKYVIQIGSEKTTFEVK